MKRLLQIIFTFFPLMLNAQVNIKELENLLSLDYNSFETRALSLGYEFKSNDSSLIVFDNSTSFIIYTKGKSHSIEYQTRSKNQYLLLKNSCINYGYKFRKSVPFKDQNVFNQYDNGKYILTFYTGDKNTYRGYNIAICKFEDNDDSPGLGNSFKEIDAHEKKLNYKAIDSKKHDDNHTSIVYDNSIDKDKNLVDHIFIFDENNICIGVGWWYLLADENTLQNVIKYLNSKGKQTKDDTWIGQLNGQTVRLVLFKDKNSLQLMSYKYE